MRFLRLGAFFTALALLLTACASAPADNGSGSSCAEEPPADVSGSVLPQATPLVLWNLPEPPRLILTQEDVDAVLTQVMEEHSAAAVSVATVERGQLSQAGAWGWAVKTSKR